MTKLFLASAALAAVAAGSACAVEHQSNVLAPSASAGPSYIGLWRSSSPSIVGANTCGNFDWQITQQTATTISGLFTAQCGGDLKVSGSAWAQLNGTAAPTIATAGATGPGISACNVSLTSSAVLDGDTIRMPYTGSTCLGPVSGSEVLKRQ